jgi:uncharacterized protein YndB with AHSA1/START domain
MSPVQRLVVGLGIFALIASGAGYLLHHGTYGWTLFAMSPILLGAVVSWFRQPETGYAAARIGAITGGACTAALLFLGAEGAICIIMALPITIPMGALGGWLVYFLRKSVNDMRSVTAMLLLPIATLAWDLKAHPPVYAVTTQVVVNAQPEQVWKYAVEFSPISESREWYFHTGVAYPQRTRVEGQGVGAARYCELSTGPVVERISVWEPPRLLSFDVISTPDAMHEWSPYGENRPKHLHGYYVSKKGEFRLTPLPGGRTLLQGTSWYQHGLWPAEYWRWWSDAIIHRIHMRVLNHVRTLAEADALAEQHAAR